MAGSRVLVRECQLLLCISIALVMGCATPQIEPEITDSHDSIVRADMVPANIPALFPQEVSPALETLYSVSVDDAPLSEVLRSLAQQAGLILDVQVPLEKSTSLHLVDKPLRDVLAVIVNDCDCLYSLTDNRLTLSADVPFSRSYAVDYLNIDREIVSNLAIATRVGNLSVASTGSDNRGNASRTGLTSNSTFDLWQSIDSGLRSLLRIKADDLGVQVNSAAGLIVVHARDSQQRMVAEYLARLQTRVLRQVSIEAQVIEIELNESHASGVDWTELAQSDGFSWLQNMSSGFAVAAANSGSVLQYNGSNKSSSTRVLVNLLEEFGDVRVISAPRVVALNNQPSVLSVVENKVYFSSSVKIKSSDDESAVTESVETAIHTVPVGLVMQVTPQVATTGDVVLSIRPTISRVSGYVNDPNPSLAAAGVVSRIPEIQVRELETVLRVNDGETIVLGGMMQLSDSQEKQNVPWLHSLPILGGLFRSRQKSSQQAELLVLLTPTVLASRSTH